MKKREIGIIFFCITVIFFIGCNNLPFGQKTTTSDSKKPLFIATGTVVALVNDYPVTLEDLREEIERINATVPEDKPELRINTREKKIAYLKDEIIKRILLYQEALDRGLDRDYEIQKQLENSRQQLLVFKLIRDEAANVQVASDEIENYYNTYKEQLKEPEERKVREIVVISQAQAKDILIKLLQGEDFSGLARQYSKSPNASKGGDLGFLKRGTKFKEFDDIAFSNALGIGGVSSVFKGPDGYYIVKVEQKKGGTLRSLSEMWDDLKRGFEFLKQQGRINELVGNLSRKAKIEVMEDKVE